MPHGIQLLQLLTDPHQMPQILSWLEMYGANLSVWIFTNHLQSHFNAPVSRGLEIISLESFYAGKMEFGFRLCY